MKFIGFFILILMISSCRQIKLETKSRKPYPISVINKQYLLNQCNQEILSTELIDKISIYKSSRNMYLYKNGKIIYNFKISLGKNPKGHKLKQGDFKTPIGRYKISLKRCDKKYYRAIHISYPDAEDLARGLKNGVNVGSGITIHSQPTWNANGDGDSYTLSRDWTQGCIAITTADMQILWSRLMIGTPIEIRE